MKIGVLIVNIGTPKSPSTKDVGVYLKKFLMDEDVISLPFVLRWVLVNLIIVPFRAVKSAAKYAKIWTPQGSPLQVNTEKFVNALAQELGAHYSVKIGMAFSEPSIETSLIGFKNESIDRLIICPMFPQYAEATTGSVLKGVKKICNKIDLTVPQTMIKSFYKENFYIDNIAKYCKDIQADHWLFSYHGLPEKQITKNASCLLNNSCCLSSQECTKTCYRSHCIQTTKELAKKLNLNDEDYTISFQSRLGVKRWLQPYTDGVLRLLPQQNKINIAVVSPAFVADCLETLEEINLESRHLFLESGGESFQYIPCLNADPQWVSGFAEYIKENQEQMVYDLKTL